MSPARQGAGVRLPSALAKVFVGTALGLIFCQSTSLAQNVGKQPPERIGRDDVKRVKQSTVLLRVTMPNRETADGSGFFALEPGLIITNAHVLGMLSSSSKPPVSIQVMVNSGEANEAKLKGKVVGVDRANDLGIVCVVGDQLPGPLTLDPGQELVETQKVYIFGFPFGVQLGKNITIGESTISSLRTFGTDSLQQIQINGGIHPGNSGGPIVNTEGKVIGVAVAVIRGTQINFAIPVHFVSSLAMGRVSDAHLGEAFKENDKTMLPVKLTCLDPLEQIKEIRLEVWTGPPGKSHAPSDLPSRARPGDAQRRSVSLTYQTGVATANVALPAVPAGQVCWLQPVIVSAGNKTRYGMSLATPVDLLPVERKPSRVAFSITTATERTLKVKSVSSEVFTQGKLSEAASDKLTVDMLEIVAPEPTGGVLIRYSYGPTAKIESDVNGTPVKMHVKTSDMFRALPPNFIVGDDGGLKSRISRNINPKLPVDLQADFRSCFSQLCNGLESVMLPVPSHEFKPLEKFTTRTALLLSPTGKARNNGGKDSTVIGKTVDLMLTCTYEGIRRRNNRDEALITVVGQVKGRSKGTERAKGEVNGKFGIDVEAGFVSMAKLKISTENESPGGEVKISFALDIDLDRQVGNPFKIAPPPERKAAPK